MSHKRLFTILGIVGLLLVIIIAAGAFLYFRAPKAANAIPPGGSVVHVGLYAPQGNPSWPLNSYIPLTISIDGSQPLASVDLFVNGTLYESRPILASATTNSRTELWNWQPGTSGDFILVAHAKDVLGATGISQPVFIHAVEASGTTSPVPLQPGDSLTVIAARVNLPISELEEINPQIPPDAEIPEDQPVFIPNLDPPVTNQNIIPGITPPEEEEQVPPPLDLLAVRAQLEVLGSPPQDSSGDAQTPEEVPEPPSDPNPGESQKFNPWLVIQNNLKDLLKNPDAEKDALPPKEPTFDADFKGCDVTLRLQNSMAYVDPMDPAAVATYEDGFYLYRSRDGGTFERIATWPAIVTNTDVYADLYQYGYKDTGQYGNVTYTLAAFNSVAEVPSKPVTLPLDPANCSDPSPSRGINTKVSLKDGELSLPFAMDLAYFYIQVDTGSGARSQGWRVPEGDRTFLPDSGKKINLYTYLNTILDKVQAPDLSLTLEVWGWWGGQLVHAGDFTVELHRSVLLICSVEGEGGCTGNGGGKWVGELTLSDQKPLKEQSYEVKWLSTNLSPIDDVCIQLAAGPFPGDNFWSLDMPISSGCMDAKQNEGVFTMNLAAYLYPSGPKSVEGWGVGSHIMDYDSNWFQYEYGEGEPFTLYLRVYPRHETSGFNRYTNTVAMHYKTAPVPSELPPLASTFDSMVEVEILEDTYVPPNFETPEKWGCVIVDEDPTGQYAVGQEICPGIVPPHDDCAGMSEAECLLLGAGNALGFLYDQFAFAYEAYKTYIAQGIAMIIPGCDGSSDCKAWIKKGVDYGASYVTGLPATMPKSEELIGDSVAEFIVSGATEAEKYYTGYDYSAIEAFCSYADCQEEISKVVQTQLKTSRSIASQPACVHGYEAYFHGQQPVCLDPVIIVHPAQGSYNYPGAVLVRVTRKTTAESLAIKEADLGNYKLDLVVQGTNTYNGDALDAPLYETARIAIPWLEPGSSAVLMVPLNPCKNNNASGCSGGVNYYGFDGLYLGGVSHMKAVEACYSSGSSVDWVPCKAGGIDTWEFNNPSSKTELP